MTKYQFFGVLFLVSGFCSPIFATSTVCSGEQLYYSDVKKDYGQKPRPGTILGTRIIVHEGVLLVNHEFVMGLEQGKVIPYQVELTGKEEVLEETGNPTKGSRIFKQTAVLLKMKLSKATEVDREEVVCQSIWVQAQ